MSTSDLVRATVAEFGSCSMFILKDTAIVTEIAKMALDEVLPCSMVTMQDSPINDIIKAPVRIFLCFVKHLLDTIEATGSQNFEMIEAVARLKWETIVTQYNCTPGTQAQPEQISIQLLKDFNDQAADANDTAGHAQPDSNASSLETEGQLPFPARRAWHALSSMLLTLKLVSCTLSTNAVAGSSHLLWRTLFLMKEDLAFGLKAFAEYSQQSHPPSTTATEAGKQGELSSSAAGTSRDIQLLSLYIITLLSAFLRRAVTALGKEESGNGQVTAMACMGIVDVFLRHGHPSAGHRIFTAGTCSGCAAGHATCCSNA